MWREASYYLRMTVGWWKFMGAPTAVDARAVVRQDLAKRETNFLDYLKRGIFASAANPCRRLFEWAGCEYGDVQRLVHTDGLESALHRLRREGVYLSHDEFKGKTAVVRGAHSMQVCPEDFVNTLVPGWLTGSSSGSRSRGTIASRSIPFVLHRETQESLFWDEFGVYDRSIVALMPVLPATMGLQRALNYLRRGACLDAWFTLGRWSSAPHYHGITNLLVLESRIMGLEIPFPMSLPHSDFSPVARRIAGLKEGGRQVALMANVSAAVRVAVSALELGLDISGSQFFVGAEALTDGKQEVIERAGVTAHARYGISEIGLIGMACPEMRGNCVHLMQDSVAAINHRQHAPLTDVEVDSLLFTPLRAWAPFALVNVEMDDAGLIGPARCNCGLKSLGVTQQVDRVFSYGKLTGQGTTLVAGDLLDILEKRLPERFGGAPTDYQLVEREAAHQTEIELRVHPRLGLAAEGEVKRFFLAQLSRIPVGAITQRLWGETEGIKVIFAEPLLTGNRKVLPLHLLGTPMRQTDVHRQQEESV